MGSTSTEHDAITDELLAIRCQLGEAAGFDDLAVAFTALFTLGTLALGQWGGTGRTWFAAGGMGMVMLAVAIVLLVRARRRFRKLSRRRTELEHLLTSAEGGS